MKRLLVNKQKRWALLFFLGGALSSLAAQTQNFPSLEPDSRAAEYGRRLNTASYTWEALAEASLWASGGEVTSAAMNTLRTAVAELAASAPADPRERGEYVLAFMYKKFMKSYVALQTRVDTILTNGRYNCVSSAVLYMILAVSSGLDVQGVMTKDHAFVTLNTGSESIDIETTNPHGFDPGNRKEFHDNFGNVTGFAYVSARNYRDRADIGRIELISLILTNRISELESRRRVNEAILVAVNRAAFLEDRMAAGPEAPPLFPDASKDLLDRIFNFGASLIQGGREEDALRWSALAAPRFPDEKRWEEYNYTALNNLMVKQLRGGKIAEARDTLKRNEGLITAANKNQLDSMILDAELVKYSNEAKTVLLAENGMARLKDAEDRKLLPAARIEELRTFFLLKAGEYKAAEAGWAAAITYTEGLITLYGRSRQLEDQLKVFRSNRVAELHNAFAAAYNRRNVEEALRIINSALEEFPDNRQLIQDRDAAQTAAQKAR